MRNLLVLVVLAAVNVACVSGVDRSTVAAPVGYQAVGPVQTYGLHPAVRTAVKVPTGVSACLLNGAARVLGVAADTANCIGETIAGQDVVPVTIMAPAPAAATPCVTAPPLRTAAPCLPTAPPAPAKAPGSSPVACASDACSVK